MNECFNSFEINGYLNNIIYWKQCCPKYANIFTQIENFFIQIRNKYLELSKNIDALLKEPSLVEYEAVAVDETQVIDE